MTHEERVQIGSMWIAIAEMNGKEISQVSLKLMIDSVSDLPGNKIIQAMNQWIATSKQPRPPLPAEIRELVLPKSSDRDLAVDISRNIDCAISRHGWNWEEGYYGHDGQYWEDSSYNRFNTFKAAFISELGVIAWHAVCSRGGWHMVRNSANEMEEGTFIAQLRDQIECSMSLSRSGVDVTRIEMPKKQAPLDSEDSGLFLVKNLFNKEVL